MAGTAALLRRTYDAKLDDKATRGTVVERRIPDVPFVFDPPGCRWKRRRVRAGPWQQRRETHRRHKLSVGLIPTSA